MRILKTQGCQVCENSVELLKYSCFETCYQFHGERQRLRSDYSGYMSLPDGGVGMNCYIFTEPMLCPALINLFKLNSNLCFSVIV